MANLLLEFENHPKEREIISTLLIGYGELEFGLMGCLGAALNNDMDTSTRILFRVRGESPRIEVADAIIRPIFTKVGLGGKWGNAVGAARVCKNVRNQYAHCHWLLTDGILRFVNLDAEAGAADGPLNVEAIPLKIDLLGWQLDYFKYALDWLYYLHAEYNLRVGKLSSHEQVEPTSIPAPPLHIQPRTVSPGPPDKTSGSPA